METTTKTAKTPRLPKPTRVWVNTLTGKVEFHVAGALGGGRLEKKAVAILKAIQAKLPEGTFAIPPKALWRLYIDGNIRGGTDAYEITFLTRNAVATEKAFWDYAKE